MLEKTISTDSTLGLQKAVVKLTLPAIELTSYSESDANINAVIKSQFLDVISEILDKQLK